MNKIKVTDLDEFVLKEINNPFLGKLQEITGINEDKIVTLSNAKYFFELFPEWGDLVKNRIKRCNFYFPKYICNELLIILGINFSRSRNLRR